MALIEIPLGELQVGDEIAVNRDGSETVEVLEILRNPNTIGDGSAANYSDAATSEFPIQWSGIRSSGTGYTDTKVRVKRTG
jgi:hypothetical protein